MEMNNFLTIDMDTIQSRTPLGLNNDFDRFSLGMAPEEFIMIGGHRGSGKSVVCANVVCSQYLQGNSALCFTIEMSSREYYNRYISILSDVPQKSSKSGKLTDIEKLAIARVRAKMTADGSLDLLEQFELDKDFNNFERKLIDRPLTRDNRIITIDNPSLTIANIDGAIHTYKTTLEDKLKVVVVDYINQLTAHDPYSWQVQIDLSKKLKALARKYDVVMLTPFQTSEEGKVRFAKGILDSPDWAFNLSAVHDGDYGAIEFECKKSRGDQAIDFASEIHWPTLKIYADKSIELVKNQVSQKKETKKDETKDNLKI